jgi:hypothetical protein
MPTPATETGVIAYWVDSVLRGDAAIAAIAQDRIYEDIDMSGDLNYVKIVFRMMSGIDLSAVGATRRVYVNAIYQINAIWQQNRYTDDLDRAAARIDVLFHGQAAAVPGGSVLSCVRVAPIRISTTRDGVPYRLLGGQYRIYGQLA